MDWSKDATRPTPVLSAQATRYASAKSMRFVSTGRDRSLVAFESIVCVDRTLLLRAIDVCCAVLALAPSAHRQTRRLSATYRER